MSPKLAAYQWIEIFNRTDKVFTFAQMDFALDWDDDTGTSHLATTEGFSIDPHSFRVLAFRPAVLASAFGIANTVQIFSDLIEMGDGSVVGGLGMGTALSIGAGSGAILLDSVTWRPSPFSESENLVARQLDPDAFSADLNNQVNFPDETTNLCSTPAPLSGKCVWCSATSQFGVSLFAFGTPGYANLDCPGIDPSP